ncbi:hypothetical protein E8E12_001034 [Didymella heteroderae]|uniref:Uncharacterized protein n=1 Tax=Didymella heteroderae TaxID=1769908 RepID=A0A9P4WTY7_9PLEO|nr:hypothetical protein E8E12_001034 [Didymella heteroderae]
MLLTLLSFSLLDASALGYLFVAYGFSAEAETIDDFHAEAGARNAANSVAADAAGSTEEYLVAAAVAGGLVGIGLAFEVAPGAALVFAPAPGIAAAQV